MKEECKELEVTAGQTPGTLLLIGEIGNGKSTTANYLMQKMEIRQGKNPDDFDID